MLIGEKTNPKCNKAMSFIELIVNAALLHLCQFYSTPSMINNNTSPIYNYCRQKHVVFKII